MVQHTHTPLFPLPHLLGGAFLDGGVGSSSSIGRMEGGGEGRTDLVPLGRKNLKREGGGQDEGEGEFRILGR